MKPLLHLVEIRDVPILQQLEWEEALLRADQRNWCLINRGSPPAIVMGISGKMDELVCSKQLEQEPLPVIRRFSGGGTVVVDENTLFVTFIFQTSALSIQPFPRHLMEWSAEFYRPLFPGGAFQLRENDYVHENRKWGGNAQSITKGRWLHHSTLLWDFHLSRMKYLLMPSKVPEYRQRRSHEDFLCRLKDFWPSLNHLQEDILEQLNINFKLVPGDMKEIERIAALPHRKATTRIR